MASKDNDYDPHEHRVLAHPISNSDAFISLIKCAIGTGCLAMPMAFSKAGWLNGLLSCTLIGVIMVYSLHMLLQAKYEVCKRLHVPRLSYCSLLLYGVKEGPTWLHLFSLPLALLVDLFMALYHFGVCCVYIIFIAENLKQILDAQLQYQLDNRLYMCALALPLTFLVFVRDLKHLVPFSALANALFFCGFSAMLYYIINDLAPLSQRLAFGDYRSYPIFFGTVLFAIESIGVLLAIEENMATPKAFLGLTGILNRGMVVVMLIYATFGFLGYWRYGSDVRDSITLNLPYHSSLSQLIKMAFAVSIFLSYALQGYVTIDVIWQHCLLPTIERTKRRAMEYVTRLLLVIASVFCSMNVPNLGPFLSLVGSLCLSFLCLIAPALLDICIKYKTGYGRLGIHLIKDALLFVFGVVGGALGSWMAVHEIINSFKLFF